MYGKFTLAAIVGASLISAIPAQAADMSYSRDTLVHKADYDGWRDRRGLGFGIYIGEGRRYGRCSAWRDECGDRWGYGSWRYDRCLARRGC